MWSQLAWNCSCARRVCSHPACGAEGLVGLERCSAVGSWLSVLCTGWARTANLCARQPASGAYSINLILVNHTWLQRGTRGIGTPEATRWGCCSGRVENTQAAPCRSELSLLKMRGTGSPERLCSRTWPRYGGCDGRPAPSPELGLLSHGWVCVLMNCPHGGPSSLTSPSCHPFFCFLLSFSVLAVLFSQLSMLWS